LFESDARKRKKTMKMIGYAQERSKTPPRHRAGKSGKRLPQKLRAEGGHGS